MMSGWLYVLMGVMYLGAIFFPILHISFFSFSLFFLFLFLCMGLYGIGSLLCGWS